ncbi:hexameric tyrosine-coordinated heme protein [Halomonas marinisediminis]|nr:hexameric tyrosine-coordinated heme protein [Halomonas marinisediminis]
MRTFHHARRSGIRSAAVLLLATLLVMGGAAAADSHETMSGGDTWLPSLITETPQQGFALAVTLSQKGVATTQPDAEVRRAERPEYAEEADSLIAVSHVIATHFQTVAAANDYWRE